MIVTPSADELLTNVVGKSQLNEDLTQIGLAISELEVQANSPLVGEKVGHVEMSGKGGSLMVAIRKPDGTFVRNPPPDLSLAAGDVFIILGHHDVVPTLAARASRGRS